VNPDATPSVPDEQGEVHEKEDSSPGTASLEALRDVSMPIIIEIGRTSMTVNEILKLGIGSVVQLDRLMGEPVDIHVSDRKLAEGEVVVIGEHLGVRVTRVLSSHGSEAAS
jgi:flagellar motor switch protein FliN/FliY